MWHLVRAALNPPVSLRKSLKDWPAISQALREAPRARRMQVNEMEAMTVSNAPVS